MLVVGSKVWVQYSMAGVALFELTFDLNHLVGRSIVGRFCTPTE